MSDQVAAPHADRSLRFRSALDQANYAVVKVPRRRWPDLLATVSDPTDLDSRTIVRVVHVSDSKCRIVDPLWRKQRNPRSIPLQDAQLLRGAPRLDELCPGARVLALWRNPAIDDEKSAWTTVYYPGVVVQAPRPRNSSAVTTVAPTTAADPVDKKKEASMRGRRTPALVLRVRFDYGDEDAGPKGRVIPLSAPVIGVGRVPGVLLRPYKQEDALVQQQHDTPEKDMASRTDAGVAGAPPRRLEFGDNKTLADALGEALEQKDELDEKNAKNTLDGQDVSAGQQQGLDRPRRRVKAQRSLEQQDVPENQNTLKTPQDVVEKQQDIVDKQQDAEENQDTRTKVADEWTRITDASKRARIRVGARVAVFWPKDRRYFAGVVTERHSAHECVVDYDDGARWTHSLRQDRWKYVVQPDPKRRIAARTRAPKRKPRVPKPIPELVNEPPPNTLSALGLDFRKKLLDPSLLGRVTQVSLQLLERAYRLAGPPSSRTRAGATAGVCNCIGFARDCGNGTQLYVTKTGAAPQWNRDPDTPERWFDSVRCWCQPDNPEDKPIGARPSTRGHPAVTPGILSIRYCNRVLSNGHDDCRHCHQPAAKPSPEQWATLMDVAQIISNQRLIPARKIVDGQEHRANIMAFTVLDYGFNREVKKAKPGIPLHQDTSCLGEAIGSLHLAGEAKDVDVLFDQIPLNGQAAGRVVHISHTPNSFYVMKKHSRWLARHKVQTTKSLGLLLRVKYVPANEPQTEQDTWFPDPEPMDAEPVDAEPMDAEPMDAEPAGEL